MAERLHGRSLPFPFHSERASRPELSVKFEEAGVRTNPVLTEDLIARVTTLLWQIDPSGILRPSG